MLLDKLEAFLGTYAICNRIQKSNIKSFLLTKRSGINQP